MVSRDEFELAAARGKVARETEPRAVEAYYDRKSGRIVLELANRLGFMFSPQDAQGLESATPRDLEQVELCMGGRGLHFPTLDADLFVPALVEGVFGSRRWMAARLGQIGGRAKSAAKAKSSRENGRLGGRPAKKAAKKKAVKKVLLKKSSKKKVVKAAGRSSVGARKGVN